jgi:hypothetical protein
MAWLWGTYHVVWEVFWFLPKDWLIIQWYIKKYRRKYFGDGKIIFLPRWIRWGCLHGGDIVASFPLRLGPNGSDDEISQKYIQLPACQKNTQGQGQGRAGTI